MEENVTQDKAVSDNVMPDKDIALLMMIYRKIIKRRNVLSAPYGLTAAQVPIVIQVCLNEGISQKDLIMQIGLEKSVVGKSIKNLIDSGYLIRVKNPQDKRGYNLYPTQAARDVLPEILLQGKDSMALLLEGFSEEEKTTFSFLLEKMAKNAQRI